MKTMERKLGRPPLPAGEARERRVNVRLNAHDGDALDALTATLGLSEPEVIRLALHAYAARKVRS